METYQSKDGLVNKFIHRDLSETCVKYKSDCGENKLDKYSIFASCAYGCCVACKFCALTPINKYHRLKKEQVINNIQSVLIHEAERGVDLQNKAVKLGWMGMGEPFLEFDYITEISQKIFDFIKVEKLCNGLDSIDIATSYPDRTVMKLKPVFEQLLKLDLPIQVSENKSKIRVFYSLHSANQLTRRTIIPKSRSVTHAINMLLELNAMLDVDIIFHHFFLDGVNDSEEEVNKLINLFNTRLSNHQLRVLRYNRFPGSTIQESPKYDEICELLKAHIKNLRFQISTGNEIKAACGQFVMVS